MRIMQTAADPTQDFGATELRTVLTVPLFPLPGALLLPRGSLPLHIFEPRYLAMVDDAMNSDHLIGVVQPRVTPSIGTPGSDVATPALFEIGCAGRITAHTQAPDGRRFITLTGISRFVIVGELPQVRGYRRAMVTWERFAADLVEDPTDAIDDAALLASLRSYFTTHSYDTNWEALQHLPASALVNLLAMMCPFEPPEKQALLEAPTLETRARVLTTLLDLNAASNVAHSTRLQ